MTSKSKDASINVEKESKVNQDRKEVALRSKKCLDEIKRGSIEGKRKGYKHQKINIGKHIKTTVTRK